MKKSFVIVFTVLLCLVTGTPKAQAQGFNPTLAAQLQSTLDSLMALLTNTKGMSASVYCPGQGIWNGASGLSHGGQPITTNMRFGIASNSKLVTAVVMLKLAENNVLTLEDSLHEWIPNYNNINPDITIRQLLNHSSGISDPFLTTALLDSISAHPTHQYTVAEVLALVAPPVFAPGGGYNYSNINYILAGMVAEAATGFHISRFIRDSILTPLQMDSTFYDLHEPESLPIAHRWENNVDFNDTSRISLNSAGGSSGSLFTTTCEFVQLYHALMDGQVISQASLTEMTAFTGPANYGLGIALFTFFGNTTWGHGGTTIGYKSRAIFDPCRKAAVFGVSNSTPSAVDGITALLYKVIVDKLPACPAAISGQQSVCRGASGITYTVPAIANSTSYVWNLPNGVTGVSNTNSITVNFGPTAVSGTISASGSNGYGIGSPSSFHVTVLPNHTITENQTICSGESIQWEGSTIFLSGQYVVSLSSLAGCDSTLILNLSVTSVPNGVTLNNTTLSADSVLDSYQWLDCDNGFAVIPGATSQSFTPTQTGNYAAQLVRGNCSDTSACTQVIVVGLEEIQTGEFQAYPNPVSESLQLRIPNAGTPMDVELLNANGQRVFMGTISGELTIPMADLASGVYMVKCWNGQSMACKKIIKQ